MTKDWLYIVWAASQKFIASFDLHLCKQTEKLILAREFWSVVHILKSKILFCYLFILILKLNYPNLRERSSITSACLGEVGVWAILDFWGSHRRHDRIKKLILRKLIGGSNNLRFNLFPHPVGHVGLVRCCRRWARAPGAARLVLGQLQLRYCWLWFCVVGVQSHFPIKPNFGYVGL